MQQSTRDTWRANINFAARIMLGLAVLTIAFNPVFSYIIAPGMDLLSLSGSSVPRHVIDQTALNSVGLPLGVLAVVLMVGTAQPRPRASKSDR